ncbi:MAG: hypothetical protein F4029_11425 [Gammaproteobacteria bacterium]|nr:hypothetical protein [Gammaproteobacteria bacterium]MYF28226.1 hypothetical protein [Gammaproteobacteria bacterium]MYK46824.1 hypothetical protein [Gammaproteobacteria bacterium]
MNRFKTMMHRRKQTARKMHDLVRDTWQRDSVNRVLRDVPLLRVVVAFLVVWAWTTGVSLVGATIASGAPVARFAVKVLLYLAAFGIPAAAAIYNMEKRTVIAYVGAALAASLPMVLICLSRGELVGACIVVTIAGSGGLIAYGIVERL